jgi:nucleoside-diphosphate-sugar epimerase
MSENKRVIITGGSGFIGTNLVSSYLERNWDVKNFDNLPPRNSDHLTKWEKTDLLDRTNLIKKTKDFGPSVFLHFGARTDLDEKDNLTGYASNIEGVCNVVDAIRATSSIKRVIFASSQLVCYLGYRPKNEYDYRPTTLYGISKVLTERIIRSADDIGAVWTIVRPTSLYGPWFDVPYKNFFVTVSKNYYIHPGDIQTYKQWGFVGNSVYQIEKLVEAPEDKVHKKMFYLADFKPILFKDFADLVQRSLGAAPIRTINPNFLKVIARIGDLLQYIGWKQPPLTSFRYHNIITSEIQNLKPLQRLVGPLPYSFEQAVAKTVNWMRQMGMLD